MVNNRTHIANVVGTMKGYLLRIILRPNLACIPPNSYEFEIYHSNSSAGRILYFLNSSKMPIEYKG
jgi:hypothetical protein